MKLVMAIDKTTKTPYTRRKYQTMKETMIYGNC